MNNASAVEALLFVALEKPTADERTAFLDSACGGDAELRRQVEKLLKAQDNVGDFLQKPVAEQLAPAPEPSDATQAFDASTDRKEVTLARTGGEGASDNEDNPLDFLQPSTRRDSLGRLGHYEVLQVLGKGGFGIVFRAFDETLQRVAAIKVLALEMAATSPARKRFLREARAAAQVRHQHVVQIYAVEEQPLPYLVMEFIPGETLQQRLDRTGPLEAAEVVVIGRQIADGLAAAHAAGLIHRDVKPANVLIEDGPRLHVKITDFGLARATDDASITQSGVVAGTPLYMSPEQARGERLDHRSDLFSLGSVLYAITAGRPPFRAANTLAVLKRVVEDEPRPIPEIIPEIPPWLCELIARLHEKDPNNRFPSARAVADALAEPQSIPPATKSQPALRRRSLPWVAALAAVVLAGAVGVGLWQAGFFGKSNGPGPAEGPGGPMASPQEAAGGTSAATTPGWGKFIDPQGDCSVKQEKGKVTITIPGTEHNLVPGQSTTAPRLLQEIDGDFTVQVKVVGELYPGNNPLRPKPGQNISTQSAGLLLWENDRNLLRLEKRTRVHSNGNTLSTPGLLEYWSDGKCTDNWNELQHGPVIKEPFSYLRLTRRGDKVQAAYSKDGTVWQEIRETTVTLPRKLFVGVHALNDATTPCTAEFDDFKISGSSGPAQGAGKKEPNTVGGTDAATIPGWGQVIDPLGDCSVNQEKGKVTITVPGTHHDLVPTRPLTAPRVLQEVAGDFAVQVKMVAALAPGNNPLPGQQASTQSAGLLLWDNDRHLLRLESVTTESPTEKVAYRPVAVLEYWRDGKPVQVRDAPGSRTPDRRVLKDNAVYFRLTRRGDKVLSAWSKDGIEWTDHGEATVTLSRKLLVGVSAVNASRTPCQVEFEDFKVTASGR